MKKEYPLAMKIKSLNNQIRRLLEKKSIMENDAELTGMQYAILGYLHDQNGKDIYQKYMESEFNIRKSTASQMITQLEEKGYLKRVQSDEDARLKKIIPTPKADALNKIATKNMVTIQRRLTKNISDSEMKTFMDVLEKIYENASE